MANFRGYKVARLVVVEDRFSGPSSYAAGGSSRTVNKLRNITRVYSISIDGGYQIEVSGVSGNTVTYVVRNPCPAHAHDFVSLGTGSNPAIAMGLSSTKNAINDASTSGEVHTVSGGGATGVQNSSPVQGAEVADGTNLSARTIVIVAEGY